MKTPKQILVRLPNWLGDMVMAYPFLDSLRRTYPEAEITVIAKEGLQSLVPWLGNFRKVIPFSKRDFPGLRGAYRFGQLIGKPPVYDLYISLPDSFSSAVMGYATGAGYRLGYRKEMRQWMLTHATGFPPPATHRSEVYKNLLKHFNSACQSEKLNPIRIKDPGKIFALPTGNKLVFNVNSNAESRRLPVFKALEFINHWLTKTNYQLILPGHHSEFAYVESIAKLATSPERIINLAGKTTIPELLAVLQQADRVVSTDTGIAHLSNLVGTKTTVLFGAGDERVTAPIFTKNLEIRRISGLACAPCVNNTCRVGGVPCLTKLEVRE